MFLLFVAKKKKTNVVCIIPACPTPEANFSRPRHVFRNLGLGPLRFEPNWRQCSDVGKIHCMSGFFSKNRLFVRCFSHSVVMDVFKLAISHSRVEPM